MKRKEGEWARDVAQRVECLPSLHEAPPKIIMVVRIVDLRTQERKQEGQKSKVTLSYIGSARQPGIKNYKPMC